MKKSDFYYDLPPELIAQHPIERRDASRLLCLDRESGAITHGTFRDILDSFRPGDCVILNNSRVLPARLYGVREDTGAVVEFLLLTCRSADTWETICGPGKKARPGHRFSFGGGRMTAEVLDVLEGGNRLVRFFFQGSFYACLDEIGEIPLPHYITERLEDRERYQTVYAHEPGSAAAPTAGLHFTQELLAELQAKGVKVGFVTLHVGLGTFRPVKEENIADHVMHSEHFELNDETARMIRETKTSGGRVIAVGTTSCRTLESVAQQQGEITACEGWTDIFIYPGYTFRAIDGLLTNFHLPESTLIMLVSAFAGYEHTMEAYRQAVAEQYRFFSFGDAMLIL